MKLIKEEYSIGTQSIRLKEILESKDGHKILIEILSDSYDFQSYARLSAFNKNDQKWNIIDTIAYSKMQTPPKLAYSPELKNNADNLKEYFQKDLSQLISNAELILDTSFDVSLNTKKKRKP